MQEISNKSVSKSVHIMAPGTVIVTVIWKVGCRMLFTKLKVDYFGKFAGREIKLKPGINLIYGENEAGKSTLHTFIKGMLFGIERLRGRGAASKEDTYTRYLPWEYPGAYGGQMDIKVGDRVYRLQRSFHANNKAFSIIDLFTGRELKLKEGHISELIPRLTEASYRNTISIEQLRAETDAELAANVRNYITNLSIAKSREVNIEKAVNSLKAQKKTLESLPYSTQLNSLSDKIKDGEAREEKIDSLISDLRVLEAKEIGLKDKVNNIKSLINEREEELIGELPAVLEKYRAYQELTRQYNQLESQVEDLRVKLMNYQNRLNDLNKEEEDNIQRARKKGLLYIGIPVVISLITLFLTRSPIAAIIFLTISLVIGGLLLALTYRKNHTSIKDEYIKTNMSLEYIEEQLKEVTDRWKSLEDRCDELHDTIMIYMQEFVSEDELTLAAVERLQEAISIKKKEASKEESKYNLQLEEYRFQIGKIRWELSQLEENESDLIKNKEQYLYVKQKQVENNLELDAINLALNTIHNLSTTIHDSFGMQLNEAVSKIVYEVTNHKYQDIKIDEKLNIKFAWNDNYIVLDRLSAGTIDQVYLALRLAASDLLLGKDTVPLIMDDSFALYDDGRVKAALTSIKDRSQVILFSCQMREKQLLDNSGISYNFIKL